MLQRLTYNSWKYRDSAVTYVVDRQSTRALSLESSVKQEIDDICDKNRQKVIEEEKMRIKK